MTTSDKQRIVWLTDTHLHFTNRYKMLNTILDEKPNAVFLTGDISEGPTFLSDMAFLGKRIGRPIYFVMGNHCYAGSSFAKRHSQVRELCSQYKNLIWMTEAGIIPINEETAIIGTEGWYSCDLGNTDYIKYTMDWWAIEDFRRLPNMKARIDKMREIANESAKVISKRLEEAIETYKTVYILTHVPITPEANRAESWFSEAFWEPYNTNLPMGQAIMKVMEKHKKRHCICICGHVHKKSSTLMSRNVECRVGKGSYTKISDDEVFYI